MKVFGILFFITAFVAVPMAQTVAATSNPSDLQVVKMSWKRDTRPPREAYLKDDKRPEDDLPGKGARPPQSSPRDPKEQISIYERTDRATREVEELWPSIGPLVNGYLYQVTVRNSGQKDIKAVHWQYIFTDRHDPSIITRHQFQSRTKISPGKEIRLSRFAVAPPSQVINANAIEIDIRRQYSEQVLITRIEYRDGSVWERSDR